MKKIILIIASLVFTCSLYGLDHGLITGFETGYNIYDNSNIDTIFSVNINENMLSLDLNEDTYNHNETFYVEMLTGYRIGNLSIIGIYKNTFKAVKVDNFVPLQDRFTFKANFKITDSINIKFIHWCDHPVITRNDNRSIFSNSGYRAISISYYKEF